MADRPDRYSPRSLCMIAGWLYAWTIVTGLFAELYVAGVVMVSGDARATAMHVLAYETLFRASIIGEILGVAAYVAVSGLLYGLLKSGGRNLAFASVLFATAGNIVWIGAAVYQFGALRLLHAGTQMSPFSAGQLEALAYESFRLHDVALNVGMFFFGIYCILIGTLIYRSPSFSRPIGALLVVGGAFDLLNVIAVLAAPALARALPDWLSLPGFIGELALTVWLITIGGKFYRPDAEQRV